MPLTPADKLRLLNLAYNQMQADFKRIFPSLFRGDAQALTTDASGYIYLPTNSFEIELLVITSSGKHLDPLDKVHKYEGTGWYHDGINQTAGDNLGKRRIMIRKTGAVWASLAVTVDILIEFPELTALDGTPYPFVQNRYINMLTELQAFMMYMEGGKETAKNAEKHWNMYQFLLKQARLDTLDKLPVFMSTAHADAGDSRGFSRIVE